MVGSHHQLSGHEFKQTLAENCSYLHLAPHAKQVKPLLLAWGFSGRNSLSEMQF